MLLAILVLLSLLTPAKGADAPAIQCFPMEHLSGVVEANPGWRILPALSDAENAAALDTVNTESTVTGRTLRPRRWRSRARNLSSIQG